MSFDPVTCAVAAVAAIALIVCIVIGIRIAGCVITFILVFLPAVLGGFAAGYFYNEQVGFSVGTIVALLMLLMVRSPKKS